MHLKWKIIAIIKYNDYNLTTGIAVKDTISGLKAFRTYNYGMNMATNIYGTVNFKGDGKIGLTKWFSEKKRQKLRIYMSLDTVAFLLLLRATKKQHFVVFFEAGI